MAEMLNSVVLKLSDEDAERIDRYCEEKGLKITRRKRDSKDLPNYYVIWGTKKELTEFQRYF